jgi:hypothetical protein
VNLAAEPGSRQTGLSADLPGTRKNGTLKGIISIWNLHLYNRTRSACREENSVSAWKGLHYRYDGPSPKPGRDETSKPEFLPRSLSDPHRVLNVNSKTPKHVVEKLVLCLRQAWHPDHGSLGERQLRTTKLQQINAAWDIINGKRPAAGD